MNKNIIIGTIIIILIISVGFLNLNNDEIEKEPLIYETYGEITDYSTQITFESTKNDEPISLIRIESNGIGGYSNLNGLTKLNIPTTNTKSYPISISGNIDEGNTKIIIKDVNEIINIIELHLFNTPSTYNLYWNNELIEQYTVQFTVNHQVIKHIIILDNINNVNFLIIEEVNQKE